MLTLVVTSIQGLLKLNSLKRCNTALSLSECGCDGAIGSCVFFEYGRKRETILPGERRLLKGGGKLLTYELLCRDCNGSAGSPPSL